MNKFKIFLLLFILVLTFGLFQDKICVQNPYFSFISSAFAKEMNASDEDYVQSLERRFFNRIYSEQTLYTRLNRIEKVVFGKTNGSLSAQTRIIKLKKLYPESLQNVAVQHSSSLPVKVQQPVIQQNYSQNLGVQPVNYNNYPMISKMEMIKFGKSFEGDDVYKRLERLEQNVYQRTINGSLVDRMDNLKKVILPDEASKLSNIDSSVGYYDESPYSQDALMMASQVLSDYETKLFQTTFPNEQIEQRLDRIEMKLFNSASPDDMIANRIERVSAVMNAEQSSQSYRTAEKIRWLPVLLNILLIGLSFI